MKTGKLFCDALRNPLSDYVTGHDALFIIARIAAIFAIQPITPEVYLPAATRVWYRY